MKRNGQEKDVLVRPRIKLCLLVIVWVFCLNAVTAIELFKKADFLPVHVENYQESLIWAVQINEENGHESNNEAQNKQFHDFEQNNGEYCDYATEEVAQMCSLICKSKLTDDVYIFVFDLRRNQFTDTLISPVSFSNTSDAGIHLKLNSSTFIPMLTIPVNRVHSFHSSILNINERKAISVEISHCLDSHPHVNWYSQQHIRSREKRGHLSFSDPFYMQQWHLRNMWHRSMDINVSGVWERNVTGQGVTVAVVDDGLEWTNPDLNRNYNKEGSWDLNSNDPDPMPNDKEASNHHGTRCAGEIAAVKNHICGVGVAFEAKVSGIRVLDGPMTDGLEAKAFTTNLQINDIYSCSWGPDDDGKTVDGPHILALSAMRYGIDFGRHGYGSIYVVASGNGGRFQDNCNFDGYANSIYTVTIGAVDETGHMPYYAEECASMLAVTFSSGSGRQRSIVTTDWTKRGGTGCTTSHTGTSAAAPIAAGMIALMLQVRPCLTWRDVQYIIIMTAQKVDIDEAHWHRNKAGLFHSYKHGFGLMKAWKLVNAAKIWEMVPWITSYSHSSDEINMQIPKGQHKPLILTYEVTEEDIRGYDLYSLENVLFTVTITHPCRGLLEILLTCPSGTKSTIATPRKFDNSSGGFYKWTFSTVRCWGEAPTGNWTFVFKDTDSHKYDSGYLKFWKLNLIGTPMSHDEFQYRRRQIADAMDGKFLNDSYSKSCPPPPVTAKPDVPMSEKTLKFIILAGIFCFVLALYETFEYAACYSEEKREQRRKMRTNARSGDTTSRISRSNYDDSESQGLLAAEQEMIPMDELHENDIDNLTRETNLDSEDLLYVSTKSANSTKEEIDSPSQSSDETVNNRLENSGDVSLKDDTSSEETELFSQNLKLGAR